MCTPAPGIKSARASLRDGLRPPLTPDAVEQVGWLSVRWLSPGLGTNAGTNTCPDDLDNPNQPDLSQA